MGFRELFWKGADPLLLKLRSRLEHLQYVHPTDERARILTGTATMGPGARFGPNAMVMNAGGQKNIDVGPFSLIRGTLFTMVPDAQIRFGSYSFIADGSRIWAQSAVTVGSFVLISMDVDIHDSNAHATDWRQRREDCVNVFQRRVPIDYAKVESRPIVIGDDVWIGFKSTVMKGVTIGRGSIVAACSVVTKDVPPFTLVAGNPARVVRELEASLGEDASPKGSATGPATEDAP